MRLRLLNAQLGESDIEAVLASLRWLKDRGYVFSETAQSQIPRLVGEDYAEAAAALLLAQPNVVASSENVANVPAEAGLVESILVSQDGASFIATSITAHSVLTKVGDAPWSATPINRASDLSGIVTEPDGARAWIASANLDDSDEEEPLFTGLIGLSKVYDVARFVAAPEGVAVSDLAIAPDSTVYASDPLGGGVYFKQQGRGLYEFIAPGTFRSPQGLAVSADGRRLYLSDYRYGLAVVDLETRAVSRLESDVPAILDGVDGLWLHQGELIAIQNGTSPMRISAFALSEDGTRITAARVLEQAHPDWTEPLGGSIAGGALYYVATGQWDRYDQGRLRDGMEAIPTQIRRLPLGTPAD